MNLDNCKNCINYSSKDMYCRLHLAGIERIRKCAIRDIVSVVRCKDCKHFATGVGINEEETWTYCRLFDSLIDCNDFCSRGERKDGADNG